MVELLTVCRCPCYRQTLLNLKEELEINTVNRASKMYLAIRFSIISVKAKSFADREIRYTLKAQAQGAAGTFNIGPTSGIVRLAKELDFEDLRFPHVYTLKVTATEDSGGFSTSVEVPHLRFSHTFHSDVTPLQR